MWLSTVARSGGYCHEPSSHATQRRAVQARREDDGTGECGLTVFLNQNRVDTVRVYKAKIRQKWVILLSHRAPRAFSIVG